MPAAHTKGKAGRQNLWKGIARLRLASATLAPPRYLQGTGHLFYGVMQDLGAQGLETVAILDHALSSRTDKEERQDNKGTSVGYLNAIVLKVGNGSAEGIAASGRSKSKAGDSVTNSVLPMPSTFRRA